MAQPNQFTDVDQAADPDVFVEQMARAETFDDVRQARRRAIEAMRLQPGSRVLDLGCGPGDSTAELAVAVGTGGEAVGVDYSEKMVEAATDRYVSAGLPVRFLVGDAQKLSFADGEFDGCRTERMLCHVPDAAAALAEMVRVTRPGGRVAVLDVDVDTVLVDGVDVAVGRQVVDAMSDSVACGTMGRRLPRLLRAAGLTDIIVDGRFIRAPLSFIHFLLDGPLAGLAADGAVTAAQAEQFWADAEAAERAGDFFGGFGMFLVCGTRP